MIHNLSTTAKKRKTFLDSDMLCNKMQIGIQYRHKLAIDPICIDLYFADIRFFLHIDYDNLLCCQ